MVCLLSSPCISPSAVFEIKMEDRGKFFDALTALSAV